MPRAAAIDGKNSTKSHQPEKLRPHLPRVTMENANGTLHAETGRPRIPGIKKENPLLRFRKPLVSMAENDHLRLFGSQAPAQTIIHSMRVHNMLDEKFAPTQHQGLDREIAERRIVGVPAHGGHGSDGLQGMQNAGLANITAVEDMFHSRQQPRNLLIKEVVSIRDDADFHNPGRHVRG